MTDQITGIVCGGSYLPEDETAKCNWLYCVAGMGLAGSGRCFLWGDPRNPYCPKFEDEETWEEIERYDALQDWLGEGK
jgi:hypothetical protein